jgi:UDP-N-acetylmuramate dehydrogenase
MGEGNIKNIMKISKNVALNKFTTFKVGGKAKYFLKVKDQKELLEAVKFAQEQNLPIFILGGGSDILMSDKGFRGLVIKFIGKKVAVVEDKKDHVLLNAEAGLDWDELVALSVKNNWQGIECMSGIPGSVGAAPIQNIGAYGQELKDTFVKLLAYDVKNRKFVEFNKRKCKFAYRESVFKKPKNKGRYIIVNITHKLKKNGKTKVIYESLKKYLKKKGIKSPSLMDIREAVLTLRGQKLEDPKRVGNAGSFFKNPIITKAKLKKIRKKYSDIPSYDVGKNKVKLFAGWLVEKAGWKGKTHKRAKVSDKHALVIINPSGKATAKEVRELADKIIADVKDKFDVILEPEVQYIDFG